MDNNFDLPLDTEVKGEDNSGLHCSDEIRGYLNEISKWNLGFACLIGLFLLLFLFGTVMAGSVGGGGLLLPTLILIGVYGLWGWLHFSIFRAAKQTVAYGGSDNFDDAAKSVKNYFLAVGIMIILGLVLFVGVLLFGMSAASRMQSGDF